MVQRINTIKEVLKKRKSVLVLGPRGSGKTYFVNHLLESFTHTLKIDLLDGALYRRYLNKPEQLSKDIEYQLNNDVLYVFIDEVQTIPQLLNEVHRLIGRYKERCVFILTGSSARKLKRNDTNLLGGCPRTRQKDAGAGTAPLPGLKQIYPQSPGKPRRFYVSR